MLAAKEGALPLEAVTDNTDAAVRAGGRQRMDRAFEAVVGVSLAAQNHLKRLVVIVPAGFADCHDTTSLVAALPIAQTAAESRVRFVLGRVSGSTTVHCGASRT